MARLRLRTSTLALVLLTALSAQGASPLDQLKSAAGEQLGGGSGGAAGMLGGLGLPSIGSGTASNAAGVLQYCIERKYLAGGAAGIKDKLLGKVGLGGGKETQDKGYQSGLSGILNGSDGKSFDMGKIQDQLKDKACGYVLDNAKSLV
ncbi:DUF2501 domain-containing protein [Pseudorhodoferax sp. Leaf274]|uniref:DUF2501 domain-containing protein n=1 Tax=Pseudorhodoferax sp. Leaf274 TaxID=1736318 RepID=UPI00070324D2|nr:DUF2501 domain-containing protein [Pseudorhodoferax sp. Leaf274]KQP43956.1 hypothetical protein ASF44_28935 [Pseudorhodoferax sp. Leaf274]